MQRLWGSSDRSPRGGSREAQQLTVPGRQLQYSAYRTEPAIQLVFARSCFGFDDTYVQCTNVRTTSEDRSSVRGGVRGYYVHPSHWA